MVGRKIEGLVRERMRLLGTSNSTYYTGKYLVSLAHSLDVHKLKGVKLTVMKNTTKVMEYWFESIPKSSVMPATLALPMLVLCHKC